ncbi:hypothetical protein IWW54_006737, partial [Coemansia sp. RSA 2705]
TTPAPRRAAASAAAPKAIYAKSGQLVKSCLKSQARASQMLSPRAAPRFVHFGSDSKQVRWFYKSEPSMNAASDPDFNDPVHTSCTAIMTPIRKPAPMFSHYEASPVVLETVEFADQTLCGTIKVHNLAFEKQVFVRMTTDEWKTVEDIPAAFQRSITGVDSNRPGVDRFRFAIPVPAADHAAFISLCVCYRHL